MRQGQQPTEHRRAERPRAGDGAAKLVLEQQRRIVKQDVRSEQHCPTAQRAHTEQADQPAAARWVEQRWQPEVERRRAEAQGKPNDQEGERHLQQSGLVGADRIAGEQDEREAERDGGKHAEAEVAQRGGEGAHRRQRRAAWGSFYHPQRLVHQPDRERHAGNQQREGGNEAILHQRHGTYCGAAKHGDRDELAPLISDAGVIEQRSDNRDVGGGNEEPLDWPYTQDKLTAKVVLPISDQRG